MNSSDQTARQTDTQHCCLQHTHKSPLVCLCCDLLIKLFKYPKQRRYKFWKFIVRASIKIREPRNRNAAHKTSSEGKKSNLTKHKKVRKKSNSILFSPKADKSKQRKNLLHHSSIVFSLNDLFWSMCSSVQHTIHTCTHVCHMLDFFTFPPPLLLLLLLLSFFFSFLIQYS